MPELVYCAGGNRRLAQIAADAGFRLGAQLPGTVYFPIYFADQNWKRPNRTRYMAGLAEHRPTMATVLDLERADQLADVLDWAEEAAQYAPMIVIIPKAHGIIDCLPRRIGNADVVLGYSVPTKFGGTSVFGSEFAGWPIHLLGGSPHAQMRLYSYLRGCADVVSADGSMPSKMATRNCKYWQASRWVPLQDDDQLWGKDAPYEAFRRSCVNIVAAWKAIG